ncbi:MAG: hypothetical protein RI942_1995 [Pseudomonadota bacterium]|jgi:hypothetical protein
MSAQTDKPPSFALAGYSGELQIPLERFFFNVDQWVSTPALISELKLHSDASWAQDMNPSAVRKIVARHYRANRLSISLLTGSFKGRLALLSRDDWLRLGMFSAVLPHRSVIRHSMDGHFRRAVRQGFDEVVINSLEQLGSIEDGPEFTGGAGAWRTPQRVALGGVIAAVEQACSWPDPIRARFYLHFEPDERGVPPSVVGLNSHWLELACKILFPKPHWLWS